MPIVSTVDGDLLELAESGAFDAIAHGCNCHHAMVSGIAAKIAEQYPEAKEVDDATDYGDIGKFGDYSSVPIHTYGENSDGMYDVDFTLINAYTQFLGGKNGSLKGIRLAFEKINNDFEGSVIGIPKIGCGVAGLKWEDVEPVINKATPDIEIIVVNYSK